MWEQVWWAGAGRREGEAGRYGRSAPAGRAKNQARRSQIERLSDTTGSPAWTWDSTPPGRARVHQLDLEGRVLVGVDRSAHATQVCAHTEAGSRPDPDSDRSGEDWGERTFSLDFSRLG